MRVGFIGLGRMGFPMARNLIKAGYSVVAHNRSRGPVDRLAALGAVPAATPAEVARSVEILVSCVLTPEQVEDIYLGPEGARRFVPKRLPSSTPRSAGGRRGRKTERSASWLAPMPLRWRRRVRCWKCSEKIYSTWGR